MIIEDLDKEEEDYQKSDLWELNINFAQETIDDSES